MSNYSNFTAFLHSGPNRLFVLVDSYGGPEGAVHEGNERNNRFGPQAVTVRTGPDGQDLAEMMHP